MYFDEQDSYQDNTPSAAMPRYRAIGGRLKLITALIVILLTWISLGLGFIAFGLFLYLHILLRQSHRVRSGLSNQGMIAPLDGQILAVRRNKDGLQIDMRGDVFGSQIIYAPSAAVIEDKLWIDGAYLSFDDSTAHPLRARYDFLLRTELDDFVTLSLFGGQWTRYIYAPFIEGQKMQAGEPFAFGLGYSLLTLQLPAKFATSLSVGDICIAGQTILATKD